MNTITTTQLTSGLNVIRAIADGIRELGQVPSGTLYATLMAGGMDLPTFEKILSILKGAGLIRIEPSGLITWIESKGE